MPPPAPLKAKSRERRVIEDKTKINEVEEKCLKFQANDICSKIANGLLEDLSRNAKESETEIIKAYNDFLIKYMDFIEIKNSINYNIDKNIIKENNICKGIDYTFYNFVITFDRNLVKNLEDLEILKIMQERFKLSIYYNLQELETSLYYHDLMNFIIPYHNFVIEQLIQYEDLPVRLRHDLSKQKNISNCPSLKTADAINNNLNFKGNVKSKIKEIYDSLKNWRKVYINFIKERGISKSQIDKFETTKKSVKEGTETRNKSVKASVSKSRTQDMPPLIDLETQKLLKDANKLAEETEKLIAELKEELDLSVSQDKVEKIIRELNYDSS